MTHSMPPAARFRALLVAGALAAGLPFVAPAAQEAAPADAKPKAHVAQPVHDAGTVAPGKEVIHDFVVENQGTAPLEITDVRPACGCTVAQFDRVIAPGASGKVHAVLDTSTFAGAISKGVTVLTNDPVRPSIQLTVKANVEPHLMVNPGYARFLQPQLSDPGVVEQRLWTKSFDELEILEVTSPYPFLTVTHERIESAEDRHEDGAGPQHQLTFVLDYTEAPVGALGEYVTVRTNHPVQPEVKIPVSGFVRPLVVVTPNEANFGAVEMGEDGAFGSLILKHYGSTPLEIRAAESSVAGVEVEVVPVTEGTEFRVRVQLSPDMPKGAFDGVIKLSTNQPRKPTLEIPVKGSVS